MIVKNKSKHLSTKRFVDLVSFVLTEYNYLDDPRTEIHIRNDWGNPLYGVALINCRRFRVYKRYTKDVEPENDHLIIIWVGKNPEKNKYKSTEECFVAILAHELRHIWYARQINFNTEESDCADMEKKVLKRYREKYHKPNNNKAKV